MAVISLSFGIGQVFCWFVGGLVAIVCGHEARRQIRQTGESGDGMAVAAWSWATSACSCPVLVLLLASSRSSALFS